MKRKSKLGVLIIIVLFTVVGPSSAFSGSPQKPVRAPEPFFTLVGLGMGNSTNENVLVGPLYSEILLLLQQQLAKIGINLQIVLTVGEPFYELLYTGDFDITYRMGIGAGFVVDPGYFSLRYSENSTGNLSGYDTSLDWNESLGTGQNEWYLQRGLALLPPTSAERVQHYWTWEQYLMDDLLPILPVLGSEWHGVHWAALEGYSFNTEYVADYYGILQSWGKMFWRESHVNQTSTDELVIGDFQKEIELNPLINDYETPVVCRAVLDPLIWYDPDKSVWPHLATSWEHLNETHLRVHLREGVKWQPDPDGLFPDEEFDAEDVYFTFFAWRELAYDPYGEWDRYYGWIKKMEIVDKYTIDFYIDADPATPANEPTNQYLQTLRTLIFPEYYLNQSQLGDGTTPDSSHPSWGNYAKHCFGTGILKLDSANETESRLSLFEDCWRRDPALLDDPTLDLQRRFGDRWALETLRIRHDLRDGPEQQLAFSWGNLDIIRVDPYSANRAAFATNPNFRFKSDLAQEFRHFTFNLRKNRPWIGSRAPCPNDPTISIGLAVRKAIAYAIDREELNAVVYDGALTSVHNPIFENLHFWCNPALIQYEHDLAKAKEYMAKAGFDLNAPTTIPTPGVGHWRALAVLTMSATTITVVVRRKRKQATK